MASNQRNAGAFWEMHGPDNDSEYEFGSGPGLGSIYVEEMSKDGVSTMTDNHFGQVPAGLAQYRHKAQQGPPPEAQYPPEARQVLPPPAAQYNRPGAQQGPPTTAAHSDLPIPRRAPPPQRVRRTPPPPRGSQSQVVPQQWSSYPTNNSSNSNSNNNNNNNNNSDLQQDSSESQHSNRSLGRQNAQQSNDLRQSYTDEVVEQEEYRDEFIPENEPRGSSQLVSRVSDWYNEIESQGPALDEEDGRQSLIKSSTHTSSKTVAVRNNSTARNSASFRNSGSVRNAFQEDAAPKDEYQNNDAREKSSSRNKGLKLLIACLCLFIVAVGAGIAVIFVVFHDGNEDSTTRDVEIPAPTEAPTTATQGPTPGELPVILTQTLKGENDYGKTVAMESDFIAVGSASAKVVSMHKEGFVWNFLPELVGDTGSAFGSAMEIVRPADDPSAYLLVGAPRAGHGTATLYKFDQTAKTWKQQGGMLVGKPTSSTLEGFGTSVAISENFRAVVGAPYSDTEASGAGRIYAFSFRMLDGMLQALPMTSNEKLLGIKEDAAFGTDVDITRDGNFLAAGAPGSSSFSIYHWDGTLWLTVFEHGIMSEPKFGSSVTFLSSKYIAVGSPETDSNRGTIRVFEKSGTDYTVWTPLPPLRGKFRGDRIGAINTVSGREGVAGPELVVGSGNGAVERYDLINSRWIRRFSDVRGAIAVTALVAVGSDENYSVFAGYAGATEALLFAGLADGSVAPTFPATTTVPTTTTQTTTTTTTTTTTPPAPKTWRLSGGPFTTSDTREGYNTMFGHAVALVGDYLAVGEPNGQAGELGDVVIRERSDGWQNSDSGFAVGTLKFGSSIDGAMVGGTPSILVGAPESEDDGSWAGSGARFGSAHFFQRDSLGTWSAVGDEMRPDMLVPEAGGKFGGSVAMASDVLRVVIGAPDSSFSIDALKTGRVYTYEYKNDDWRPMVAAIVGTGANDRFGASVAMSKDGSRMLVGSPGDVGGAGSVRYFEWDSAQWESIFTLRGTGNEALGATVAILSDDGKRIAFGSPAWGNERGRIQIYEESSMQAGFFAKVGNEDLAGAEGDRIGSTLCGAQGMLAYGTELGSFRMYRYDNTKNAWLQVATGQDVGSPVISISMSEDASAVAVGLENQTVEVYDLA